MLMYSNGLLRSWKLMGGCKVIINKVEICGVNTAKLPVLSATKMRELFVVLQNGELFAREKVKGWDSWGNQL